MFNMKKSQLKFLSLFVIVVISVLITSCKKELMEETIIQKPLGERIINEYIEDNLSSIDLEVQEKGSDAYLNFLFEVDMGDYPDFTGENSEYIKSYEELDAVLEFITKERAHLYDNYPPDGIQEKKAEVPNSLEEDHSGSLQKGSYNRTSAKNYALVYAYTFNSSYPDFSSAGGGGDCTNFVSQAVHYGGISMKGSGDGCKHEVNSNEWYVEPGGGLSCFGNWSSWEWSTPWSSTWPFRYYHCHKENNAQSIGWTINPSTADAYLNIGDVVQLQRKSSNSWSTYHTMIVTQDIYRDLMVTYHTTDTKNKKLSDIPLGSTKRFVLVRF